MGGNESMGKEMTRGSLFPPRLLARADDVIG
jgi:hypothetical protein